MRHIVYIYIPYSIVVDNRIKYMIYAVFLRRRVYVSGILETCKFVARGSGQRSLRIVLAIERSAE